MEGRCVRTIVVWKPDHIALLCEALFVLRKNHSGMETAFFGLDYPLLLCSCVRTIVVWKQSWAARRGSPDRYVA